MFATLYLIHLLVLKMAPLTLFQSSTSSLQFFYRLTRYIHSAIRYGYAFAHACYRTIVCSQYVPISEQAHIVPIAPSSTAHYLDKSEFVIPFNILLNFYFELPQNLPQLKYPISDSFPCSSTFAIYEAIFPIAYPVLPFPYRFLSQFHGYLP